MVTGRRDKRYEGMVYGGMFLNSIASFGGYREIAETRFFKKRYENRRRHFWKRVGNTRVGEGCRKRVMS